MINKDQKLNPKLFELAVEQTAIREGFGTGLVEAGKQNDQVVALCADLSESTRMNLFADNFPERFIQVGVAEQNLVTVASGLAVMGKIPFTASYAMFSPGRNWEQIRTTICYNNVPVKIVGAHAGVSVGPDGGSHQAIEDIAVMRVLPRMVVVVPADSLEAHKATLAIASNNEPSYIRLARNKSAVVTTEDSPFTIGKANLLYGDESAEVALVACGQMVYYSLLVAKKLEAEGLKVSVTNMHTIKPIDSEALIMLAKNSGAIVTVEEHQTAGGLGSAVAEVLAQNYPVPMALVGIRNEFGQSGEPSELLNHYGLGLADISEAVRKVLKMKK